MLGSQSIPYLSAYGVGAEHAFSDDALRYSLAGFHLEGLERMLIDVNRTLKRNKVFDADRLQGLDPGRRRAGQLIPG